PASSFARWPTVSREAHWRQPDHRRSAGIRAASLQRFHIRGTGFVCRSYGTPYCSCCDKPASPFGGELTCRLTRKGGRCQTVSRESSPPLERFSSSGKA